jgi:hypothetical protein
LQVGESHSSTTRRSLRAVSRVSSELASRTSVKTSLCFVHHGAAGGAEAVRCNHRLLRGRAAGRSGTAWGILQRCIWRQVPFVRAPRHVTSQMGGGPRQNYARGKRAVFRAVPAACRSFFIVADWLSSGALFWPRASSLTHEG